MPEDPDPAPKSNSPITRDDVHLIVAIFLGALIAVNAWDLSDIPPFDTTWGAEPVGNESTSQIAQTLFTDWAFPFEALSVLLLVALIGALAIAMRDKVQGGDD